MSIFSFFPILYLLLGLFLFSHWTQLKDKFSYLLTRCFIPITIVINFSHELANSILMVGLFFAIFTFMFFIYCKIEKKPILALCFCYLNIGWLGLPIANIFFSPEQNVVLLNAYIGSSIFGNTVGVYALLGDSKQLSLIKLLFQPTILAVILGAALSLLPFDFYLFFIHIEQYIHILLSFFGMSVLGIWLRYSKLNLYAFRLALSLQIKKVIFFALFLSALWALYIISEHHYWKDIMVVLMFISLLPPAANIIVLETFYNGKGYSAPLIASGTILSLVLLGVVIIFLSLGIDLDLISSLIKFS